MRLYDFLESGNGYKVRLLLAWLGQPYERIEVDILAGASRTPAFLARNPNGRIPVLELDDGRTLSESNAILHYLAEGTAFLPEDRFAHAQVLQWMNFEQYSHEPFIAVARFWHHTGVAREREAELPAKMEGGYAALAVMEAHLAAHPFFVADRYGIADIALFAYTHVAHEGGFQLDRHPAVQAWLDRVRAQPGFVPIDRG